MYLRYFVAFFGLTLLSHKIFAQAPNITYATPSNIYTVGTAITNLVPTNTGEAVPATTYAQVTTLLSTGTLNGPFAIATDGQQSDAIRRDAEQRRNSRGDRRGVSSAAVFEA